MVPTLVVQSGVRWPADPFVYIIKNMGLAGPVVGFAKCHPLSRNLTFKLSVGEHADLSQEVCAVT